jgi:hypothetical protein
VLSEPTHPNGSPPHGFVTTGNGGSPHEPARSAQSTAQKKKGFAMHHPPPRVTLSSHFGDAPGTSPAAALNETRHSGVQPSARARRAPAATARQRLEFYGSRALVQPTHQWPERPFRGRHRVCDLFPVDSVPSAGVSRGDTCVSTDVKRVKGGTVVRSRDGTRGTYASR